MKAEIKAWLKNQEVFTGEGEMLSPDDTELVRLISDCMGDIGPNIDTYKAHCEELTVSLAYLIDAINCEDGQACDWVDTAEREAKAVLAKTPEQSLAMVRANALRDAANTCCPVSGYIIRDERSRSDLVSWAQMVENDIDIEPPT